MADESRNRDNKEAIIPIIQAKDIGSTDYSDISVEELKEELVIDAEKTKKSKEKNQLLTVEKPGNGIKKGNHSSPHESVVNNIYLVL